MATLTRDRSGYTLAGSSPLPFAAAVERVKEALKDEGFGVLCEIDVQATLKEKLGAEIGPYLILGACNPPYALQALALEIELGALLPCNVAVYKRHGETRVCAVDPEAMLAVAGNPELSEVGAEIRGRLARVVERSCAA